MNDLKLGEVDGSICLIGIDVGLNGILRRVDGGRAIQKTLSILKKPIKEHIIDWGFLQTIDAHLRNLTLNVARRQLSELHPSDLAEILTEIDPEESTLLLSSIDEELAGEALHEVSTEVREKILKEMDNEMISDILEEMPPDEAADIPGAALRLHLGRVHRFRPGLHRRPDHPSSAAGDRLRDDRLRIGRLDQR